MLLLFFCYAFETLVSSFQALSFSEMKNPKQQHVFFQRNEIDLSNYMSTCHLAFNISLHCMFACYHGDKLSAYMTLANKGQMPGTAKERYEGYDARTKDTHEPIAQAGFPGEVNKKQLKQKRTSAAGETCPRP